MSVQAMSWAIEQQIVVDAASRHVLLCLANYADSAGGSAFPSVARLCADTGLSESSVRRKLAAIVALGVLEIEAGSLLPMAKGIPADRRPQVYRFVRMNTRGVTQTPRYECDERGVTVTERGVTQTERGVTVTPKPSINHQLTEKQKGGADALVFPDWLSPEIWAVWDRCRKSRKGWTPDAKRLSIRTLTKLREQGHDPLEVIEQSVGQGWTGLFPLKNTNGATNGTAKPSATDRVLANVRRAQADDEWGERGNQLIPR